MYIHKIVINITRIFNSYKNKCRFLYLQYVHMMDESEEFVWIYWTNERMKSSWREAKARLRVSGRDNGDTVVLGRWCSLV